MSFDKNNITKDICKEFVDKAKSDYKRFFGRQTDDVLALVMSKGTGDLCQAVVDCEYGEGESKEVRKYAIKVASACIQIILNIEDDKLLREDCQNNYVDITIN